MSAHLWLVGPGADSRADVGIEVDCHHRLRGPYTGVGSVLRRLVPQACDRFPELVRKHVLAILSLAPELEGTVDAAPQTLTSLAIPKERTRIYPANRTRRLCHGAFEFLDTYAEVAGPRPLSLTFTNVDRADHSDQEFLAIALRRARNGRLAITVRTNGQEVSEELAEALHRYTRRVDCAAGPEREDGRDQEALLRAYIRSDGTSENPTELAAYENADPAVRTALHDARAEDLRALGEWTLHLGAIPYHLEHGSDPMGAGGEALFEAAKYCGAMGFYHALLDYGPRGLAITDPDTQMERYWLLSTRATTALAVLKRSMEAEPTYLALRSRYSLPELHLSTGYALGMLYTRFHPQEHKDHHVARGYLNNSIAIASLLPDPRERAFHTVFQRNGLALVEMHLGNLPESLRLVSEGLERLNSELPGESHRLHRSVLVHNRGRVYAALGQYEKALADFDKVIELDPNYPDYYFDRSDIRRKLGELDGALADCDTAIAISAPFYELHYNRADLRVEMGDIDGAVADLSYVVELEPDQIDARANLVSLLLDTGRFDEVGTLIEDGIRLHPDDARLPHLRGQLALEAGEHAKAKRDFDLALNLDPHLVAALAGRAALAYDDGAYDAALADLDTAVEVDVDNPDLLYNRGVVHQSAGNLTAAVRDYTRAMDFPDVDRDELLRQRELCYAQLGGQERVEMAGQP